MHVQGLPWFAVLEGPVGSVSRAQEYNCGPRNPEPEPTGPEES